MRETNRGLLWSNVEFVMPFVPDVRYLFVSHNHRYETFRRSVCARDWFTQAYSSARKKNEGLLIVFYQWQ